MTVRLMLAAIALGLTGCAAPLFQYQAAPGEPTATLKLGVATIPFAYLTETEGCPKKRMDLHKEVTVIPANKRLWVEPGYSTLGVPGGSACVNSMSFVAQEGKEYFLVYEIAGRACNGRILTRNAEGKLALEPSIKREKFELCMM